MLDSEKREGIQVIIEERAAERDPEHADGNLPDLAGGDTSDSDDKSRTKP
jgi:hypothetical protein